MEARTTMVGPRRHLLLSLVLLGAALRLWQWGAEGSLWLDEIVLTRNIEARSMSELLTHPLAFDQVAPLGFLAAVKLSTMAFGVTERALWLVPLLVGLAALFLFRRLAERALQGVAVPLAMALFVLSVSMIRYSAEVKQYGIDATMAVALTLLAYDLRARDRSIARLALAGAAAFLIILFSQSSVLVMAGLGAAMLVLWLLERDARTLRVLLVTVPMWAVASALAMFIASRSMTPSTRAFMQDFWAGGFLPLPPRVSTAGPWLWGRLQGLYADPWTLRYPFAWAFAFLALIGVVALWRQRRETALFIAAPFLVTVGAAIAQHYPFRTRLVVFLVPSALLAVAAGAGWLADLARKRSPMLAAVIIAAVLIPPVMALADAGMPTRVDNYLPFYRHLQANRQPGDAVHVGFLANSSAIYYGPRFGLQRGDYTLGACHKTDPRAYLRDVDRLRGRKRVWILAKNGAVNRVAYATMHRYLETIGVRRATTRVPSGVIDALTLDLYDLSDPNRLRAASAETFPAPPLPPYPTPGCRDWSGEARLTATSHPQ
jgi:hypothetical protein